MFTTIIDPTLQKVRDKYCFGWLHYVTEFTTRSYKHDFSWSYRQILAKSACTCYLDMVKSLVSFSDLDLIFKVTMRHKLKYLSKTMTSVPHLLNQTVNFIWIYTNIFYGQDTCNELTGDHDLFASVTTRRKMPNANLVFKLLQNNWCGSLWLVNTLTWILMYAQEKMNCLNAGDLDPTFKVTASLRWKIIFACLN